MTSGSLTGEWATHGTGKAVPVGRLGARLTEIPPAVFTTVRSRSATTWSKSGATKSEWSQTVMNPEWHSVKHTPRAGASSRAKVAVQ